MHCEDCNHWMPKGKREIGHNLGLGKCANAIELWTCTEGGDLCDVLSFKKGFENTKAFVQDGEDFSAELLTRPDFGCLSFTKK